MKYWSISDEQRFLARFDALWHALKGVEGSHAYLTLAPADRYWMDTYPPLIPGMNGRSRDFQDMEPDLEKMSRECNDAVFSLYFHIGFCRRRCAYCRQYEVKVLRDPAGSDLLRRYVDLLVQDVDISLQLLPALRRHTRALYFGGGTPSMLPLPLLGRLLEHLLQRIDLSILSGQSTFEVNPEDDVRGMLEMLKAAGIPRISIGVQSFDDRILRFAGRHYSKKEIFGVVEEAARHGFETVNLDLINGFPLHREFDVWKREIEFLESLLRSGAAQSATIYMLHPFPGTKLRPDSEDACWQTRNICFAREYLIDRLQLHERPVFWFQKQPADAEDAFAPYFSIFGYGNSSYSSLGRWLLQNEPSLQAYLGLGCEGKRRRTLPIKRATWLTRRQMQIRSILFAIRSGSFRLRRDHWDQISPGFQKRFQMLLQDGLLEQREEIYRLTETGKIFAHQLPLYFFDDATRRSLQKHLKTRFT
jgi:coproporphyrinogen III oxidase-like Fe-S oxidoreductase